MWAWLKLGVVPSISLCFLLFLAALSKKVHPWKPTNDNGKTTMNEGVAPINIFVTFRLASHVLFVHWGYNPSLPNTFWEGVLTVLFTVFWGPNTSSLGVWKLRLVIWFAKNSPMGFPRFSFFRTPGMVPLPPPTRNLPVEYVRTRHPTSTGKAGGDFWVKLSTPVTAGKRQMMMFAVNTPLVGGFNQPMWKICSSKWVKIFPK